MCEIEFVKWAIEIDEKTDLPCINLYYTMDYDNNLWSHKFLFDELLKKDEEPNFRSIIYNLILEKENQYISCDDEWMKPAHHSDHLLEKFQNTLFQVINNEITYDDFWKRFGDFSFP